MNPPQPSSGTGAQPTRVVHSLLPIFPSPCKGEDQGEGPYPARERARFKIPPPHRTSTTIQAPPPGLFIRHQLDAAVLRAPLSCVVGCDKVSLAVSMWNQLARRNSGLHQVI